MKLSNFQRSVNALMAGVMVCSSLVFPFAQAHAQTPPAPTTPATPAAPATSADFVTQWRNQCSLSDCAFTERVPLDNWSVISTVAKPQGDKGRVDGTSLYQGE